MKIEFYKKLDLNCIKFKFVVILSKNKDKWVLVKHKKRETWEFPGGHCENNETLDDTAKRELYEETGAVEFIIDLLGYYSVERENSKDFGAIFFANIKKFDKIPINSEMEKRNFFNEVPENLTYPKIYSTILNEICDY